MIRSTSPHDPADVVVETAAAGPGRVEAAFASARTAQQSWRGDAAARATALDAVADQLARSFEELADLIVREVGKPVTEARGEVARSVAILRYYAQQVFDPIGAVHEPSSHGLLYTHRRPRGVAGLITPWNFPVAIPLWKAAPALAFGNAVVLTPAPEATACALRLAELMRPHLPEGLVAVLPGGIATGEAIIARADVLSFTGSTRAGTSIAGAATARGIPVQAEMGGQNPAVVLPDAHLTRAASQIASAAMGFAGQKCTATKRIIVVGDPTEFREALISAVGALEVGDPAHASVAVGPVISEVARNRVLEATISATRAGGRLLVGGAPVDRNGWYVGPTVVEGVPREHLLAREEVFGPICVLQQAADLDEAIALANSVTHGLAASLHTSDLTAALTASTRLEAGLVKVNAPTSGVDFHLPFGGEKASSLGPREQGKAAHDFYTSSHTVTIAPHR